MELHETVDYYIKSTWHSLTKMYNQIAIEHGLTQAMGYVLIIIDDLGTPATQIAPLMGSEPTSLSRLLKSMENKGLIFRQGDKEDKRVVRIFLTEAGKEKRELARRAIFEFNERISKNINPVEIDLFKSVIYRINELTKKKAVK